MDTKTLFSERRSATFFNKDKQIEDQLLKDIINLALEAPSAFNLQPWRIIVVKSEESKRKLFNLSNQQDKVLEAPATLIIIGNKEGYADSNPVWTEMLQSVGGDEKMVNGAKEAAAFLYGSSDERKLKFAESNAGLLSMAIMIAAKEYGVDSHPMSGIDFDGIHKEFSLKEEESAVMTIGLGYYDTTKELYPRRPRRLFDEIATIV
ncbi:MAG: nitroreductase family protein [Bacteroidetes bacterium]|nr:MAG: nitroreductase family protein [Bacteroidota bacterium]